MNEELLNQLKVIVQETSDATSLQNKLMAFHPYDLAQAFLEFDSQMRQKLYSLLTSEQLADIFAYTESEDTAEFLQEFDFKKGASVLSEMESDDASDVLKEVEQEQAQKYLQQIESEAKEDLTYLATHLEDTAGSIMTTNYIALNGDIDVKQAMKSLIKEANESEIIDPIYVLAEEKLVGIVSLKNLIIASSPKMLKDIKDSNLIFAQTSDKAIEAVNKINDYGLDSLPVLEDGKMVGIITIDDAIDVMDEESNEDYSLFAGMGSSIKETLLSNLSKRLPWLLALLVLSMLVANAIQIFEDVIKQVTILIFFQSMILDMAGNAGTQSLAVSIRSIDKKELENAKNRRSHFLKELRINFFNGLILSAFAFVVCSSFLTIKNTPNINIPIVAMIIAFALAISIMISGVFGSLLPMTLNRLGIDPSVASGPFITTLNDIVSTLVYFGLAYLLLAYI
ncbi:MAG: magnesium transporter [Bacilli bacterium]|nr:magnesium transporter [Bacilli bacterium]